MLLGFRGAKVITIFIVVSFFVVVVFFTSLFSIHFLSDYLWFQIICLEYTHTLRIIKPEMFEKDMLDANFY